VIFPIERLQELRAEGVIGGLTRSSGEAFRRCRSASRATSPNTSKPPHAVFVQSRMGRHFGVPFHVDLRRQIILSALELITTASESGEILDLPLRWTDVRREGALLERA